MNSFGDLNEHIEEYIQMKRNQNLNGFNQFIIDINDKIDDFIEYEKIKDKQRNEYYNKVQQLKEDIDFRIYLMKLISEKERENEIKRKNLNRQFYILNYDKNSGEVSPNNFLNPYERRYELPRYGNPYDKKVFNNNRQFMPAKINKNGISLSNQYISIDNPGEYYKYQIYDRYRKDYNNKDNILQRSGSNFIKNKFNNNRRLRASSSSDNIYYNY